jgi:L-aspartate oxidase
MERYHPLKELAPRDVVARSIIAEMERTGAPCVFLDLTHLEPEFVRSRFPHIYETCLHYGIDLTKQPAPVHPAAHYAMGGVRTDLEGRTNLRRLFAAGEVACTGVHGANRLASNSLLEGVVFGARAGMRMRDWAGAQILRPPLPTAPLFPDLSRDRLRLIAWEKCGILRSGGGLAEACRELREAPMSAHAGPNRDLFEVRNMREVALLISRCAVARQESRGGHYRTDYPDKSAEYQKHSLAASCEEVTFV